MGFWLTNLGEFATVFNTEQISSYDTTTFRILRTIDSSLSMHLQTLWHWNYPYTVGQSYFRT